MGGAGTVGAGSAGRGGAEAAEGPGDGLQEAQPPLLSSGFRGSSVLPGLM